ncbi:MAG: hypothetical protein WAK95_17560, partial [Desulfobacterales bacterium]
NVTFLIERSAYQCGMFDVHGNLSSALRVAEPPVKPCKGEKFFALRLAGHRLPGYNQEQSPV